MNSITTNNTVTMTSLELVEYINSQRRVKEAILAHSDFLKKVPQVLGDAVAGNFSGYYKASNGKQNPMYTFPKREACLMAMSYSYDLQAKVFDKMTALENAQQAIDPMKVLNDPAAMRGLLLGYTEKVLTLEHKVEELTSKAVTLDLISSGPDTLTMTQVSKILGVKLKTLIERMNAELWIYRQNGSWVAYHRHIQSGNLVYKEAAFVDSESGMAKIKPYCHVTPKGLVKLAMLFGVNLDSADKGSFKA